MHRAQKLSEKYLGSILKPRTGNKYSLSSQLPRVELLGGLFLAWVRGGHVLLTEPQRVHHDIGQDVSLPSYHAITDVVPSQDKHVNLLVNYRMEGAETHK